MINRWACLLIILIAMGSCSSKETKLSKIKADRLAVSDSLNTVDSIENFVAPYRQRVNEVLDQPLVFNPEVISENDGVWNSTAGNLMADIVLEMAEPIYFKRTGRHIDMAVLNHGGVRSGLPLGDITARHAYEMMPFENIISVVTLSGAELRQLISFLVNARRAHPVSGIQIVINREGGLSEVNIQGRPFDESNSYNVATSSYLVEGGEEMGFFPHFQERTDLDYLLRNSIIDYFKKVDTLSVSVDDRFYQMN